MPEHMWYGLSMKIIFEFDPHEDKNELWMCRNASKMWNSLWTFRQWLRDRIKHGDYAEKEFNILEKAQEEFFKTLEDNNINLDEVE